MPYIPYTQEQKRRANAIDLSELLLQRGEGLLRAGSEWRLSGNHSITIRGNEWFDHATQRGGRAVSFVQYYYGMTYQEAMCYLLNGENGEGYPEATINEQPAAPKQLILPPRNANMRRLFAYLSSRRGIGREIIHYFIHRGLLYEDFPYHNTVFVGMDEHGVVRHAHKRSTNFQGHSYRCNVAGSLPEYSFHHIGTGSHLYVFEAPIDLLSFLTLCPDRWEESSYTALCGTGGQAMHWVLKQAPQIHDVFLCLDNDKTGKAAVCRLAAETQQAGYRPHELLPDCKDWNDELLSGQL